jgi:hypothetical protein
MNLKYQLSTLCLLSMSALLTDGALAQPGGPSVYDAKVKFAEDYNARKYRDVIADAAALQKLHAMDEATAQVTAQAYYLSGDKSGCVKYIWENLNLNQRSALLLKRCQTS